MRFSHTLSYDAAPAEVHAMLADPAFREAVCEAMHTVRHDVSVTPSGTGMRVVVDQTQPANGIPGFAKKFVGEEIQIVQSESWADAHGADLDVAIPGKPGHLKGAIVLSGDGSSTTETVSGEIKVNIPLLGGRLEGLIGDMLASALRAEQRVGRSWLNGG